MSSSAIPTKTLAARQLLAGPRALLPVPMRMLLINVDGKRSMAELQDMARALGLGPQALSELQRDGLIAGMPDAVATRRPELTAAPRAAAPATAPAPAPVAPATPAAMDLQGDLQKLMRAKMFAFDLACRMLAGRDTELRARAREVNSESSFLAWLSEAAAQIEAASDSERAQLFRERVAQAAA